MRGCRSNAYYWDLACSERAQADGYAGRLVPAGAIFPVAFLQSGPAERRAGEEDSARKNVVAPPGAGGRRSSMGQDVSGPGLTERASGLDDVVGLPDDRESRVLIEIARAGDAKVAFGGLRRKLGVHQEILARSLRRLARDGLVEKDGEGYRITERGYGTLRGKRVARPPRETLTLAQTILPPRMEGHDVALALGGRWFRGLRWYGRSEQPGETTLSWLVEGNEPPHAEADPPILRIRVSGGMLAIEAESDGEPDAALAGIRPLLAAVATLYAGGVADSDIAPSLPTGAKGVAGSLPAS
jgi:hypothetical protein